MSDLLEYAKRALATETAAQEEKAWVAKQTAADKLRKGAVVALKALLPQDRTWNIETGSPVQLQSYWRQWWSDGIEVKVDDLVFGYGESSWNGVSQSCIFLQGDCSECGDPVWLGPIHALTDIARHYGGSEKCYACSEKEAEIRKGETEWAYYNERSDGSWVGISWEGQISTSSRR